MNTTSSPYLLMTDNIYYLRGDNTLAANQSVLNSLEQTPYDGMTYLASYFTPSNTSQDWIDDLVTTRDLWAYVLLDKLTTVSGIDVDDRDGGLTRFFLLWTTALTKAAERGTPGVLLDPEWYLDYTRNDVVVAAAEYGVTVAYMETRLRAIGAQMIDTLNSVCPGATILNLLCATSDPAVISSDYVMQGMLDEIVATGSSATFIAGGQGQLNYENVNLSAWEVKWSKYRNDASYLATYPAFRLGVPLFMWDNPANCTGFLQTWLAANPTQDFTSIRKFQPMVDGLQAKFQFIWVYIHAASDSLPFDSNTNAPFNDLLWSTKFRPCRCA